MTVYAVIGIDPYLPDHGYDERVIAITLFTTEESALERAEYLGKINYPFKYCVEPMEVFE